MPGLEVQLAFFKAVEVYRQGRPFLEICYFLLVSGLEAFARHSLKDFTSKNAATPVVKLLEGYGFRVFVEQPAEPACAISTFFHIRNALLFDLTGAAQLAEAVRFELTGRLTGRRFSRPLG